MGPACDLIQGLPAEQVLADRAHDADRLIELIEDQGGKAVIPPRRHRKEQREKWLGLSEQVRVGF